MLSKKETRALKSFLSKSLSVLARCLVKPTVVANTRAWSFFCGKAPKQNSCDIVDYVYPKFSMI